MDSEEEKKIYESLSRNRSKSKSAGRITDDFQKITKKQSKHEKSYKVGNYLIKNTLGCGTFGKVKLGIYLPTKEKVAVKIWKNQK